MIWTTAGVQRLQGIPNKPPGKPIWRYFVRMTIGLRRNIHELPGYRSWVWGRKSGICPVYCSSQTDNQKNVRSIIAPANPGAHTVLGTTSSFSSNKSQSCYDALSHSTYIRLSTEGPYRDHNDGRCQTLHSGWITRKYHLPSYWHIQYYLGICKW